MTPNKAFLAPAKVNLTLHVTGKRADGYHLLDSLVVFADVGDRITLTEAPEMSMSVTGPFAAGVPEDARNLAWRAAQLAGWRGHIALDKHLPHGAGIGGGSSDAGAILNALGCPDTGLSLGADVPVCTYGKAARMSGIGETVTPMPGVPPFFAVLVNPGAHVPTPKVFQSLHAVQNSTVAEPPDADAPSDIWLGWLRAQRNDLEEPARRVAPVISEVLEALQAQSDVRLVRMSGSGATCFGLFENLDAAQAAAKALQTVYPKWWCAATRLT